MNSVEYWSNRQAQRMYEYMEDAESTTADVSNLYYKASRWLSVEMQDIFERYQKKHKLTDDKARQLLNRMRDKTSIDELKRLLASSSDVTNGKNVLAELESPAYAHRIERLQKVQQNLDALMQNVYQQEKNYSTNHYIEQAIDVYNKTMFDIQQRIGYGFSFSALDARGIDKVIKSRWSGKNYSTRIWTNTQALAQDLKEELLINMLTGRTNREAADILANKFAQSASAARRLIRTESCYVSNQLEMQAYEECGIKTYLFVATLDLRTSIVCQNLDGKRFKVSEQKPGSNCPPMHPWCRSTTICDISSKELEAMKRRARDPETGRSNIVAADMTYKEWYKRFVKDNQKALIEQKKIKNQYADKKQQAEFRALLGKEIPDSFRAFQELKYNNLDKWEEIKNVVKEVRLSG